MSIPVLTPRQLSLLHQMIEDANLLIDSVPVTNYKSRKRKITEAYNVVRKVREMNKVVERINGTKEVMREVV